MASQNRWVDRSVRLHDRGLAHEVREHYLYVLCDSIGATWGPLGMESIVVVQLSDAHIGQKLMENRFHRVRKGYNPHEDKLFDALVDALDHAALITGAEAPPTILLVGDLTAGGTNNDFAIANAQLFEQWPWSRGITSRTSGFGWDRDRVWMVPGNHDHWRSEEYQRSFSSETANLFFEKTPWRRSLTSPNGGLVLELHAVDSNAGFRDKPDKRNLFASGKLHDDDLRELRDQLVNASDPPDGFLRVRAFICHHALQSPNTAKPLNEEGRKLLQYLAGANGVRTILTGHTHVFYPDLSRDWSDSNLMTDLAPSFRRLGWDPPEPCDADWVLHELRSAAVLAGPHGPGAHGFLVHRIERHDHPQNVVWRTWKYQTSGKEFLCEDDAGEVVFTNSVPQ